MQLVALIWLLATTVPSGAQESESPAAFPTSEASEISAEQILGEWRDTKGQLSDIHLSEILELSGSPMIKVIQLSWDPKNRRFFYQDGSGYYRREIWVFKGPLGFLYIRYHHLENTLNLVYRRPTAEEVKAKEEALAAKAMALKLAKEKQERTEQFILAAEKGALNDLLRLEAEGVDPRAYPASFSKALAGRHQQVVVWLLDTHYAQVKPSLGLLVAQRDLDLLRVILERYPALRKEAAEPQILWPLVMPLPPGKPDLELVKVLITHSEVNLLQDHIPEYNLNHSAHDPSPSDLYHLSLFSAVTMRTFTSDALLAMLLEKAGPEAPDAIDQSGRTAFDYLSATLRMFERVCAPAAKSASHSEAWRRYQARLANLQKKLERIYEKPDGTPRKRTKAVLTYGHGTQCHIDREGEPVFRFSFAPPDLTFPLVKE